jgi:hypothetical protein
MSLGKGLMEGIMKYLNYIKMQIAKIKSSNKCFHYWFGCHCISVG